MIAHSALGVLEHEDTDEALVKRVRQGDNRAFEELYRRHSRVAVSVAHSFLGSSHDAEDAVSEAFTNVLSSLRREMGPQEKFRPYLLASVRNSCRQRIRRSKQACRQERIFVDDEPLEDERIVESAVAAAAFQSLPARWQSALWMAEVEFLDPVTIAERLDVDVAAAGALVYRARQRFTEAYLTQHLSHAGRPACAALAPKLARYVRGTAGLMASRQVKDHIDECPACTAAIAELADVNSSLRSLTPPLALMTAAGTTAAAVSGGSASVAVSGLGLGWLAKIAAIAVISTTPVLLGADSSKSATGVGRNPANVVGSPSAEFDTHPNTPRADTRDPTVADNAADERSPVAVEPSTGLISGRTADVDDPRGTSAGAVPPTQGGTSVGTAADDADTVLTTLPALPTVTLPAINVPAIALLPEISVPAIPLLPPISTPAIGGLVPALEVPAITVPPIVVPAITLPAINLPSITLPPITLPPIPGLPVLPLGP